jgi:hypothetical protein
LLDELKKIDATIADLRRRQCEIAEKAIKQMPAYEKYTELCFMKNILSKPETKLLLLLQTVEEGSASELLTVQFEGKIEEQNAEEILKAYYQKVSSLASSARNKNSFWAKFSLYIEDEATPKTETERVKREMRDNTIRNIHRKYGSDMFQPEHMAELAANLRKMGININDISEKRIRQIIMRR